MKQYYLTVAAIVKNEAPYLREWIEFHRLQGVEHFFIFDNASTDGTKEILEKYKFEGLVTYEVWDISPIQFPAYRHFLKTYGYLTTWCAFIDVDEFLFTTEYTLNYMLRDYEPYGALAVNWVLYGSSGQLVKEPGLVIERFIMRANEVNRHVKSIVQPEFTIDIGKNAHYFKLSKHAVDENYKKLPEKYYHHPEGTIKYFRINHYYTKSKDEHFKRKSGPAASTGKIPTNIEEKFVHHDQNEIEDKILLQYAHIIKERL